MRNDGWQGQHRSHMELVNSFFLKDDLNPSDTEAILLAELIQLI